MTFEAVPPGQQPTSMTPNARSAGRPNNFASNHASKGITVNCARQPVSTSFGRLNTTRKSDGLSVKPMPNMINPSIGLMTHVPTLDRQDGKNNENNANSKTSAPIQRAIKSHTFFIAAKIRFFPHSNK